MLGWIGLGAVITELERWTFALLGLFVQHSSNVIGLCRFPYVEMVVVLVACSCLTRRPIHVCIDLDVLARKLLCALGGWMEFPVASDAWDLTNQVPHLGLLPGERTITCR